MKVFVTGLTGFLGASVARELVGAGHDVAALCRSGESARIAQDRGATALMGNLDSRSAFASALRAAGADAVVHIASLGFGHASTMVSVPVDLGVKRVVFVSTTALFTNLNAGSKAVRVAAENAVTGSSLDWTIVRPTMIYGRPGDRNIERLVRRVRQWPVLPLPGSNSLQQPVHVDDLATAIVNALDRPEAIQHGINVPGPEPLTFREIVEQAAEAAGTKIRTVALPVRPVVSALRLVERLPFKLPISSEQVARLDEDKVFDGSDAANLLGHHPRPFLEGARLLCELLDAKPT